MARKESGVWVIGRSRNLAEARDYESYLLDKIRKAPAIAGERYRSELREHREYWFSDTAVAR